MKATIQKATPMNNNQWGIIARDETGGQIHTIAEFRTAPKVGDIVTVKYRGGKFIIT